MNVVSDEVVSNGWSQMNWSQLSAHQVKHFIFALRTKDNCSIR